MLFVSPPPPHSFSGSDSNLLYVDMWWLMRRVTTALIWILDDNTSYDNMRKQQISLKCYNRIFDTVLFINRKNIEKQSSIHTTQMYLLLKFNMIYFIFFYLFSDWKLRFIFINMHFSFFPRLPSKTFIKYTITFFSNLDIKSESCNLINLIVSCLSEIWLPRIVFHCIQI